MKLAFQSQPILPEGAYDAVASFVGLRQNALGEYRQDEKLKLCLGSAFECIEGESQIEFRCRNYDWIDIHATEFDLPLPAILPAEIVSASHDGQALNRDDIILQKGEDNWQIRKISGHWKGGELCVRGGFSEWNDFLEDIKIAILEIAQFHYEKSLGMKCEWPAHSFEAAQKHRPNIRLGF